MNIESQSTAEKCFSQSVVSSSVHGKFLIIKQPASKSLLFQSSHLDFFKFFFIKTSNNFKIIRDPTAVTALSEHFSLFVMEVSLQFVDFYLCCEVLYYILSLNI